MKTELTDLTLILDRSGSMDFCRKEAEIGANAFIQEQKGLGGECLFTLVQFDHEYLVPIQTTPIREVGSISLEPRGMTALLDAIGRAINEAGDRLAVMAEEDRPGLVMFVVVTDGEENSSREFTREQIKEMIKHQQDNYSWRFTFLGANQDSFTEGSKLGFSYGATSNFQVVNSKQMFRAASNYVGRLRNSCNNEAVANAGYTIDERSSMESGTTVSNIS